MKKVWFITGAARGFGFEIAKAALAEGDNVIAAARSNLDGLVPRLGGSENLLTLRLDVTNENQAKEAAKQSIDHFGRIDVLVNNAGYGLLSAVEEASDEEIKKNYGVNVFGTLNVIRAVLPYMRKQRSGHVINISSVGGLRGSIGWGLYASTKFAIEGFTEALALELAPLGIHATAVEPGYFRTEFLDTSSLSRAANMIEDYKDTVGKMRETAAKLNKKQPGDPKKLALAFIKLANAENPPVHLPLGKDTLLGYREKIAAFEQDIAKWENVITDTDYESMD